MTLRLRIAAFVATFALACTPSVGEAAIQDHPERRTPAITPTPQSARPLDDRVTITSTVTLIADEDADRRALDVIERALRDAGARQIVRADRAVDDRLTVHVGSAEALGALGAQGPDELPAEGYVLGIGRDRIVLAGKDDPGTYYAAQTLRQVLPHRDRPGAHVAGLVVRDWPAAPLRGVIEGFYGTPWSHEARLDQLDFYGEHKMNIYVYSPKDDPYLRDKWREPYPAPALARIEELADAAEQRHVDFTYALSPGLSVCYSSEADTRALIDKFRTIWDIGVRTFAVPLDDISYTRWNCPEDQARWGTGGGAAGAAQAHLLNRVNREFIAAHPGAEPLQMVPTEYYNVTATAYKKALAEQLDADVVVEWTGIGVIAPTMTVAQARAARSVFGHEILTWDNYPVNDYVTHRLLLGPFSGREKGLPAELAGITANPMIQPYASKIALFTVADYTWNDRAYDPRTSWLAALRWYAGGDGRTERALRAFADVNYSSRLNVQQAPELAAEFERFWQDGDADALLATLEELRAAPSVLRDRLPEQGFVDDAGPWLGATTAWAEAAGTALRLVESARDGDAAEAWELRGRLPGLLATAQSFVYTGLGGAKVPVVVGEGVLDTFVEDARAEHDRILGVPGGIRATSSIGTYRDNVPARMIDDDDTTFYWSSRAPRAGDHVGVDLRQERPVGTVTLAMGKPTSPNDYVRQGVLEYSSDGTNWQQLTAFSGTPNVTATAPEGTRARYVRARATAGQSNWLVVREFAVATDSASVTGGPPPAAGSTLRAAADGDPDTAYRAGRAPEAGEALTVDLGAPRAVRTVKVLQPGDAVARAVVELRSPDGSWRRAGEIRRPYSQLNTGNSTADAVRLVWRSGTPQIAEVVVR
ncbi:beta-N-acetylglucosaminidase domain-containing protein [Streptomyces sp. ISL-10]|uniref:beta-N-acetylglucosaminidase domain-containing protein n=1 Tax=Streptomyces sp. ISL-10 TaxID=2819172 RepID=UPI001BE4F349|nr:beta-N-acetylglucosaminidase domain-containing protein [Streptomyces sp. ISL-10]MBT2368965.1 beta-N-acetylglucosaminidase domain-containing protein [Streptomyces sp. ISL-10]